MGRQHVAANGHFNASEVGVPGAYGSNPVGLFTGPDLISRSKTNASNYGGHYQVDISSRVRQEVFAGFFLSNNFFQSPFGPSYNKDLRGQAEARTVVSVSSHYLTAVGYAASREEVKNTFITDSSTRSFPLRRDQHGIYWENREYSRAADELEAYLKLVPKAPEAEKVRQTIKELRSRH